MSRSKTVALPMLVALAVLWPAPPARAVTQDAFLLRSGADVVALCSTPADDPLYTAAVHMCHGFGAGTYQTIMAMTRHEKIARVLCPPDPQPSRNEVVQQFVEWAKQNPSSLNEPAVETVGRFLLTRFPCSKP
jgi:hypothetical protein